MIDLTTVTVRAERSFPTQMPVKTIPNKVQNIRITLLRNVVGNLSPYLNKNTFQKRSE